MNEEKNNVNNVDEELCEAIANLYHCMQERKIYKVSATFDSGNEFEIEIKEKPIRLPNLDQLLGKDK